MADIDHSSPVPLYYQLKVLLQEKVQGGELQPGDQIPTEAELCAQYDISRTPVRQALLELTREGMLTRTVGRGTFVAPAAGQAITLHVAVSDERWQWPLNEAAQRWNEANGPKKINLSFRTVALNELHDHLALAVAMGQAPDISVIDSVWVAEFAHRRYLCPPGEIDAGWVHGVRDDLFPSLLRANSYNDDLYAIPTNADAAVLWYRRDWLSAEGLDPPGTWDELRAVALHFRQPDVRVRYGLGEHPLAFAGARSAGETTTYQLLPLLWSNGGNLIADGRVVLDSPATVQTLAFLKDLLHKEALASPQVTEYTWDSTWRAFARGDVALAFGGTYENFLIQSEAGWEPGDFAERAGFVPLPAGPQGQTSTLVGGMSYGIYRQTDYAAEALALLKLALSPSILRPFSLQTGQNPALISVTETISPQEDSFLGRAAQLFSQAGSRPSLPAYERISAQFQEMVELSLAESLAVEDAVRRAAERIGGITGLPTT